MRGHTTLAGIAVVALLGAAASLLVSGDPPRPKGKANAPYYKRTGFLSKLLQDLDTSPRGLESIHVPDGFEVTLAAKPGLVMYPMFITFDDRGRLFVCESAGRNIEDKEMEHQSEMRIRLLEDTDGDGIYDRSTVFADKISMTMGAQWYQGSLYVAAPPDVLRLEDTDGDGVADRREVVLTGWPLHSNGTTLHGPFLGPDGWMYLTYNLGKYNIRTKEGATLKGPGGRVFRFRPDGSGLEWIVGGGYDNGIEMVFTGAGEMIGTITYYRNPKAGERDALLHYVEGGVYPKVLPIVDQYPRTGDLMPALTKFARIAPAGLARYRGANFGREYQGNLFSAQFNPHRVQRHIIQRSGATFSSADEDFLTSDDPDFHPTDVAEDADGSLLVVETGAWYLHSCPVSRIAKPEIRGALYRVRRKGAAPLADPWGKTLRLASLPPAELVRSLGDARPAVRDQAVELLVHTGEPAVSPLAGAHSAAAVFALGRIGRGTAPAAVRDGLQDADFEVRIAAARMAGMARDRDAVPRLMEMVQKDEPPVRRQAATALGQIGDPQAVTALLRAAAKPVDRFLEHAIIYSLILLRTPEPVAGALKSGNPATRKAALIALDQMDGSPLGREQIALPLRDRDADLRRAALWVVARHPAWAGEVIQLIQARLAGGGFPAGEEEAVQQTLVAFCGGAEAQAMVARLLGDRSASSRQQLFLLDTIGQCAAPELPASWKAALRQLLSASDDGVRARVLALARTRQLSEFDDDLEKIAASARESKDIRAAALSVLVMQQPKLSDVSFQFLLELLRPQTDADLRQTASQILARARLDERQLLALAREAVPQADPLILPNLLDAFGGSHSVLAGKALVEGLLHSPHPIDGIAAERIPELLQRLPGPVQTAAQPLMARIDQAKKSRAARLKSLEPLLRFGDIDRGREIFFGAKAGCSSCHTIMAQGGDVGPDLTGVGAIRSGIDLLEAVVYPSASFVPGHEVYRVETEHEVYTGVQGEGTPDAIVIISGPRDRVRIPRKAIRSIRPSAVSLMPDGFADNLTHRELSDLLAFLQAQKFRVPAAAT